MRAEEQQLNRSEDSASKQLYIVDYDSPAFYAQLSVLRKANFSDADILSKALQQRVEPILSLIQKINKLFNKMYFIWMGITFLTAALLVTFILVYFDKKPDENLQVIVIIEWGVLMMLVFLFLIWFFTKKARSINSDFYSMKNLEGQLSNFLQTLVSPYTLKSQRIPIMRAKYRYEHELELVNERGRQVNILIIDKTNFEFATNTGRRRNDP